MGSTMFYDNRKQAAPDTPYGFARNELDRFWAPEPQLPQLSMSTAALLGAVAEAETMDFHTEYSTYSQPGFSGPALCGPIFDYQAHEDPLSSEDDFPWPHHHLSSPQTIAPGTAFQQHLLTSSPIPKLEPSTPCRRAITSSSFLDSSPLALVSPPILPSQHEPEDLKYDEPEWALLTPEISRRRGIDRLARRSYDRKRNLGSACKPKPTKVDSGINCEVVIAQNEFACSYPGCIDKQTGKQKRFKRQEHKKRHEKTVHEKNEHGMFKCWVKGCKTAAFTRTDNLKSHLKNTHGKKSPNQRNRYVATQDKNSIHFNPDWEGELDDEGYPVHPTT
jgi:hypothetical protein